MSDLITISKVRGFIDEDGTAQLNLEDVSRGLGFTTVAASGNGCVRWSRVREYLASFGFLPQMAKNEITQEQAKAELPEFIPENIFYLLSMKANNQTAVAFQMKVANEILPTIRKTGSYSAKQSAPAIPNEPQRLRAEAMLLNAKTRQAKVMKETALEFQDKLSNESIHLLIGGITEILVGKSLLPLPTVEKTYSATEIGAELGVSSNRIGKIANRNNLKTDKYGITVLDKSQHSSKQVPAFRYNERGREKLKELVSKPE